MRAINYYFKSILADRKLYYLSMFILISVVILFLSFQSYIKIETIINKNTEINKIFENWLVVKNETVKYVINKPVENIFDKSSYERIYRFIESVSEYEISMENIIDEKIFYQIGKSGMPINEEISKMIFIWQDIQFKLIRSIFYSDDIDLFVNEIFTFITETDDFEISMRLTLDMFNHYLYNKVKLHWTLFTISICATIFLILLFSNLTYNYSKIVEKEKKIRELSRSVIKVRDNERIRIAADLHDVIVQNLLIIKRYSTEIISDTSKSISKKIKQIKSVAEKSIHSVREISFNLRPPELLHNLSESMEAYCKDISSKKNTRIDFFNLGLDMYDINQDIEITIYRLFIESVNNALNHSNASLIIVRLILAFPNIILKIEDNGKGFIYERNVKNKDHMGIRGMEDRVNLIDGTMTIRSVKKIGTLITFKIPCRGLINEKTQSDNN